MKTVCILYLTDQLFQKKNHMMNKSSNLPPTSARREGWFNESARYHFARLVSDLTSLETPLREALQNALLPGETICWMIDAPYQGLLPKDAARRKPGFSLHFLPIPLPWVFTPDWILALTAQRLLLMQTSVPGKEPKVAAVPLENILFLRSGGILLFSWLEVHWVEFRQAVPGNDLLQHGLRAALHSPDRDDPPLSGRFRRSARRPRPGSPRPLAL